jgi:hypothetical protein
MFEPGTGMSPPSGSTAPPALEPLHRGAMRPAPKGGAMAPAFWLLDCGLWPVVISSPRLEIDMLRAPASLLSARAGGRNAPRRTPCARRTAATPMPASALPWVQSPASSTSKWTTGKARHPCSADCSTANRRRPSAGVRHVESIASTGGMEGLKGLPGRPLCTWMGGLPSSGSAATASRWRRWCVVGLLRAEAKFRSVKGTGRCPPS